MSFKIVNVAFYELLCAGFYYEKMLIIEMLFSFISGIHKNNILKRKSSMDAYMINHKLISIMYRDNFESHGGVHNNWSMIIEAHALMSR